MKRALRTFVGALVVVFLAAFWSTAQDQPKKQPPKKDDKKAAAWVEPDKSEPSGMKYRTFKSKTIDAEVSYLVYLPPGYDNDKDRRYPVVYWLHGRGGSQTGAGQFASRLDTAIAAGKAPPMIVVGVNGMRTSSYVDSADGKVPVQSVIVKDLVPHIDATYRTIAKREGRAVEGFSMGGAGAPKIGFKHPDVFGTVSVLAGALHDLESYKARGTAFQDIYGGKDEYFQANSPWKLAEANADAIRGKTFVRVVVGDKDSLFGRNRDYHDLLDKLAIDHEFHTIKGAGHTPGPLYDGLGDKNWEFYTRAFAGVAKPAPTPKSPSPGDDPVKNEKPVLEWQRFECKSADGVKTPALWTAPPGKGPFPAVVFFHGAPGGIGEDGLRKLAAAPRWKELAGAGFVVCVADYRGHPKDKPFEALQGKVNASDDAVAVLRHLKSLPPVDAKRVCVIGGSLGGAVTLEALAKEDVACAVLNAPATFPFLGFRGRPGGKKDRELDDGEIDKAGALARIDKIKCPVLIVQGTADGLTPLNRKLATLMKEAKKDVRIELFEGQGHGFTNGPDGEAYRKALKLTVEFMGKHAGTTADRRD